MCFFVIDVCLILRPGRYPWWLRVALLAVLSGIIAIWFFGGGLMEAAGLLSVIRVPLPSKLERYAGFLLDFLYYLQKKL